MTVVVDATGAFAASRLRANYARLSANLAGWRGEIASLEAEACSMQESFDGLSAVCSDLASSLHAIRDSSLATIDMIDERLYALGHLDLVTPGFVPKLDSAKLLDEMLSAARAEK